MQRYLHHRLSILAACALVAAGAEAQDGRAARLLAAEEPPLIVVTTAETPPYSFVDEATGEIVGIELEIVRAAAAKLGRRVEARRMKFEELLPAVKSGEADMASSGISITAPRKADVDFSIPYAYDGGMFLYRAGERMPTMVLAETMRVAVLEATTYDFYLCFHGIDPTRFRSFPAALKALQANEVDAVFNDSSVVKTAVAASGGTLAASRLETRENFGIAVRKGLNELKDALNETIMQRIGGEARK